VIGGALVTANLFGQAWRPVFLVNVPIGLAVLVLVPLVVPADVPARGRRLGGGHGVRGDRGHTAGQDGGRGAASSPGGQP
jgi:hypothetical protein